MTCGVGRRHGLDPELPWLWCRPVATAPVRPLAWEPPYALGAALEKAKRPKKKSINNKGWRECEEKGTLLCYWWDCKLVQPLWKTVWIFLRKLKIGLPFDPAILLLGNYPEKTMTCKDTCTPMFIEALYAIAKTWKQPKCPSTKEWIRKMWYL